jgi:hypothetical protein
MKKYKIPNRCPKLSPACVPLTYLGWDTLYSDSQGMRTWKGQFKMSSSKNIDLQRDFAAGVYLFQAHTSTPHTVYV